MNDNFGGNQKTPTGQLKENRSILKEIEFNTQDKAMHSPLNSKLASSTHIVSTPVQELSSVGSKTPNKTFVNTQLREASPAAAPATVNVEEQDLSNNIQAKADSLNKVDLHENSMPKRFSTKFIALHDFDDTDIPDLPDESNPEFCEDPLRLSFDGTSTTLSTNSTITFNTDKIKELNASIDAANSLTVNETDTALSSDNEIYTECQSYRDSELNYEFPMDTSGAEHYQSAFNTHENTLNCEQEFNATFNEEKQISPIINKDNLIEENCNASKHVEAEDEPMDVDGNSTLEISNNSLNNTTIEANYSLNQKSLEKADDVNDSKHEEVKTFKQTKEIDTKQPVIVSNDEKVLVNQSFGQASSAGATIECNKARSSPKAPLVLVLPSTNDKLAHQNNKNSTTSTSPCFPLKPKADFPRFPISPTNNKEQQDIFLEPSSLSVNVSQSPINTAETTSLGLVATATNLKSAHSPANKILNETYNGSLNVCPSEVNSQNLDDEKRRSFTITNAAESLSNTPKENDTLSYTIEQNDASKRRTFNILDQTYEKVNEDRSISKVFPLSLDVCEKSQHEKSKRRTFNLSDKSHELTNDEKDDHQIETPNSIPLNITAAFGVQEPSECKLALATSSVLPLSSVINEQLKKLNESVEAMDIDESFNTSTKESAPKSPTHEKCNVKEQKLPLSPPIRGTSSLSIVLNAYSEANVNDGVAKVLSKSPPLATNMQTSDTLETQMMPPPAAAPPPPRKTSLDNKKNSLKAADEVLSAKEQTKSDAKDEKDVFVEKSKFSNVQDPNLNIFNPFSNNAEELFKNEKIQSEFSDEEFNGRIVLQPSDFEYLLSKGSANEPVDRSSLLLRFDPLVGPVLVNSGEKQQRLLQKVTGSVNSASSEIGSGSCSSGNNITRLGANGNEKSCLKTLTIEEEQIQVQGQDNSNSNAATTNTRCAKAKGSELKQEQIQAKEATAKRHANMSVDVIKDINNIDNDCTKNNYELSISKSDEKQANYKMDELEKKIKNEVLKTEDVEKKLRDAEQREEALIKRITEKDKQILKMSNVTESYEKSIAELIAEKEQLVQHYEKQLAEISADRDSNYSHLMSLETTFSDLHVKYEKSKEMTAQLKASEETLLAEKRQNLESIQKQEQRYEKMKSHAMLQLDIANKKLETMKKEYAVETTKLKAQLKKEEISRASLNEQLHQKTRENQELVKICDELISGQGS